MEKIWVNFVHFLQFCFELIKVIVISCIPSRFLTKKSVKDELVLITGSGSGIGRLLALKFAALGSRLVLVDVNSIGNQETLELIRKHHGNLATAYECDVSDREAVYELANNVAKDVGNVSILINNAGIGMGGKLSDITDEKIELVMKVNLLAQFWTVKAFLPYFKETNHGHLVHVSSVAALIGIPNMVEYSASKYGVFGFSEALNLELLNDGYDGIKVTTVCMAPINTGLLDYEDDGLIPMLTPSYAADCILHGILLEKEIIYVPRFIYPMLYLKPLVSRKAALHAIKVLGGNGLLKQVKFRKPSLKC